MADNKKSEDKDAKPKCFVIMPIADMPGYDEGHFKRVYTHLIKPACENAGFTPCRADDIVNTNNIVINILKQILESEMTICDLSGRNPNVLYELGIRQAFNKPVSLIKDNNTERIFDISSFRDYEYHHSLRTDLAKSDILKISENIRETYEKREDDINSIIQLLSMQPAEHPQNINLSNETSLILKEIQLLNRKIENIENIEKPSFNTTPLHGDIGKYTSEDIPIFIGGMDSQKTTRKVTQRDLNGMAPQELSRKDKNLK